MSGIMKLRHSRASIFPEDWPAHRPHYAHGGMIYDASLWTGVGAWAGWNFEPSLSWVLWRRWWWALRTWTERRQFRCKVCGVQCDVAPSDSSFWCSTAVCLEHCPEHDYEYDRDLRGRFCSICSNPEPY